MSAPGKRSNQLRRVLPRRLDNLFAISVCWCLVLGIPFARAAQSLRGCETKGDHCELLSS